MDSMETEILDLGLGQVSWLTKVSLFHGENTYSVGIHSIVLINQGVLISRENTYSVGIHSSVLINQGVLISEVSFIYLF